MNRPRKPLRFSWIFPAIFETAQIFWRYTYKLRRGRCRPQPFATKERYGCGSAACRYTLTRQFAPVFYKTVRQIRNCPMGRQSRRPLQQVSALPVGADDSVRPQNMSILRKSSANSLLPSGPMWASAPTTKYADAYEFAVDFRYPRAFRRAEQSPAPTKSYAKSYCFADFERKLGFPHQLPSKNKKRIT